MTFQLPNLPFADDALEPVISAKTFSFHHGKHHAAYVNKLNDLIQGTAYSDMTLDDVIKSSAGKDQAVFNNAAQHWNHSFFWNSLKPGGSQPTGALADKLNSVFGSFDSFVDAFAKTSVGHFGSGWSWLVKDGVELKIVSTHDADLPLVHGQTALLTCDLWEHSYYLDYQNKREDYVRAVLTRTANWDFAARNFT